jgi:hypothetical protein
LSEGRGTGRERAKNPEKQPTTKKSCPKPPLRNEIPLVSHRIYIFPRRDGIRCDNSGKNPPKTHSTPEGKRTYPPPSTKEKGRFAVKDMKKGTGKIGTNKPLDKKGSRSWLKMKTW